MPQLVWAYKLLFINLDYIIRNSMLTIITCTLTTLTHVHGSIPAYIKLLTLCIHKTMCAHSLTIISFTDFSFCCTKPGFQPLQPKRLLKEIRYYDANMTCSGSYVITNSCSWQLGDGEGGTDGEREREGDGEMEMERERQGDGERDRERKMERERWGERQRGKQKGDGEGATGKVGIRKSCTTKNCREDALSVSSLRKLQRKFIHIYDHK